MIILSSTTDVLEIVLLGSVTTNQLEVTTAFRDITSTTYTAGRQLSVTNNTTDVAIVSSPVASTSRVVDLINIYNKDTVTQEIIIKFNDNGTDYILYRNFIDPLQTITFIEGTGWSVGGGFRPIKAFAVHADAGANFAMTNATLAERFAGNSSRTIFSVDLEGYTQVRFRVNKMVVGTAGALFRARYYTSYSTVVGNYLQLGASAQVEVSMAAVGYADTGWVNLAAGAQIPDCYICFTELGGDGVADPAVGATDILFR